MKISFLPFIFLLSLVCLTSCKTEFETIRASGDTKLLFSKANEFYEAKEYLKAQSLYELIIGSYRGKKEAEQIYFKYAYTHYHLKKYILAAYYFKNFANTFATSDYREEADFMSAYSNYKLSPTYRLDQSYTAKAIEGFQLFVNTYPSSERVAECNRIMDDIRIKLEKKAFAEAELYYDLKQYQSAMRSFENLLKEYPDTKNEEQIRFLMLKTSYLFADNSFLDKQEDRFRKTIDHYNTFKAKFASSDFNKEVKNIYNDSTKKLKDLSNDRYKNKSTGFRSKL